MGKHVGCAVVVGVLSFLASAVTGETPTSGPAVPSADRRCDLAVLVASDVQEIARIDAPGTREFAAALADVLKRHGLEVPASLPQQEPASALPAVTQEQLETLQGQPVLNLLDRISYAKPASVSSEEGLLRIDLLTAFALHAPSMGLRLQAAGRLLELAFPDAEGRVPPALVVELTTAVRLAKAVVLESLAAANDGRDAFSMRTLVGVKLASVATQMVTADLLASESPTLESLKQARSRWAEEFASLAKDSANERVVKVLGNVQTYCSRITDAELESLLVRHECRQLLLRFFRALEARDVQVLKSVLAPKTAASLVDSDADALAKSLLGGIPRKVLMVLVGELQRVGSHETRVSCTVVWTGDDGKERTSCRQVPVVKTEDGWRVGAE